MKKLISLFLSFIIIISSVGSVTALEPEISESSDLAEFTEDFCALLEVDCNEITSNLNVHLSAGNDEGNAENFENGNSDNTSTNVELTNRIIVKSENEVSSLNAVGHVCGYNDLHVLQFENSKDFTDAYKYYSSLDGVEYVLEDLYCEESVFEDEESNDDNLLTDADPTATQSELFGYNALKQYVVDNDFNFTDEVVVGVVDTGIANDHEYLAGRIIPTGFNSIDTTDDCYDDRGHGTHVAGIIVANTLDNVKIKPYKALNKNGQGTSMQVYLGIQAAVEDGCDVINLSLSIRGVNELLQEAVTNAFNNGIVTVAASGNKGVDLATIPYSPACFDEVVTVGSCGNSHYPSTFSNYGTPCEVFAPGENIISTYLDNKYKSMSGTSMATPFITAAVTYLILKDAELDITTIPSTLKSNSHICVGPLGAWYLTVEDLLVEKIVMPVPVFSYRKTTFTESFDLTLTCSDKNAAIYYNTSTMEDGAYEIYSEPISVNYDMTVKAFSVSDGSISSSVVTYAYTRAVSDSSLFTVDENGILTGYTGTDQDIVIPRTVNGITVVGIADDLFKESDIRSVGCVATLKSIGISSFKNCDNLEYVRGAGVTTIGESAFEDCDKLYRLNCGVVETIGDKAFFDCSALKLFTFVWVTSIGNSAFENCKALEVIGNNSVNSVGNRAFFNTAVKSVAFDVLYSLDGEYSFGECENLNALHLMRATSIADYSFYKCDNLLSVTLDALTEYNSTAFSESYNIETFSFASLPTLSNTGGFSSYENLLSFYADIVTEIPDNCFKNCTKLFDVRFPAVTTVGNYAFYNCSALEGFESDVLTTINSYGFYGCTSLIDLSFEALKEIYGYCLYGVPIKYANFLELRTAYANCFNGTVFDRIDLCMANTIYDIPDNGKVVLSNYAYNDLYFSPTDAVIYLYANNKGAINYCSEKNAEYIILDEKTSFLENAPSYISSVYDKISVEYIGLQGTTTWYGMASPFTTKKTLAKNVDYIIPDVNGNYPYYRCDVKYIVSGVEFIFSSVIVNNKSYYVHSISDDAYLDFTYGTRRVYLNKALKSDVAEFLGFTDAITDYNITYSATMNSINYLGSDSMMTVTFSDGTSEDFRFYVKGDLNGDSVCDILDVSLAELVYNKHHTFETNSAAESMLRNMDGDNSTNISSSDYQLFVNQALEM